MAIQPAFWSKTIHFDKILPAKREKAPGFDKGPAVWYNGPTKPLWLWIFLEPALFSPHDRSGGHVVFLLEISERGGTP